MSDTAAAATELREALARLGLTRTHQKDGEELSTVSVWSNITVWCAGDVYFWRTGHHFDTFVWHHADDPAGAAVKVKARYEELRGRPDLFRPT